MSPDTTYVMNMSVPSKGKQLPVFCNRTRSSVMALSKAVCNASFSAWSQHVT